ncbi:MAG: YHYH protein [Actinobacteria bacterium]|nr:YHYH protein [Actinomycetota bacterium]
MDQLPHVVSKYLLMLRKVWIITVVLALGVGLGIQSYSASAAPRFKSMCPTSNFPDLSQSVGAGTGYDKPYLSIACTASEVIITSNGMTSFPFVKMTPNSLKEQEWVWRIPLSPKIAEKSRSIRNVLGTLGFTVSGVPIYGPTEGPSPASEAYGDPVYNKVLDACGGHTGPASEYHHHAISLTLACNLAQQVVLGYALDGFPIYSNIGCLDKACTQTVKLTSGYTQIGDPKSYSWNAYVYVNSNKNSVLDECNGRIQPNGTYGYHVTSTFPYIIGCYKGTPTKQIGRAGAAMAPMNPPKRVESTEKPETKDSSDDSNDSKSSPTPSKSATPKPLIKLFPSPSPSTSPKS